MSSLRNVFIAALASQILSVWTPTGMLLPSLHSTTSSKTHERDCSATSRPEKYLTVLGDSRDWFIWHDWCVGEGYHVSRLCEESPEVIPCSDSRSTNLICRESANSSVLLVMWMMYGVALDPPYHYKYNTSHRIATIPCEPLARVDTLVSKVNERVFGDIHDIVFSSNAWDVERAHELDVEVNATEYAENATIVIQRLQKIARRNVMLLTSQEVQKFPDQSLLLNGALQKVGRDLNVEVIHASDCLRGVDANQRLRDERHPSMLAAFRLAKCVLQRLRSA